MVKKNVNKKTLTNKIYENIGFSKIISENLVKDIFDIIMSKIITNNKVKITDFGTFCKRKKKERIALNPKTKEKKIVSARNVTTFKPSRYFKSQINLKS